jgi:CheY-like chemotaxis protein/HPt (histidine-containing phosphotransfer) domain-containing protein
MTKPLVQSELQEVLVSLIGSAAEDEAVAGSTDDLDIRELPALKVLLVEDGVINQRVALGFLTARGHTVIIANNGREAIEAHARDRFDAVLMDVQMPELDGFEATAIIRKNELHLGRRTPIIAMTAAAMKGDRERCLEAGMDSYIAKPISARDLFAALRNLAPAILANRESDQPVPAGEDGPSASESRAGDEAVMLADPSVFDPLAAAARVPRGSEGVKPMALLLVDESNRLLREMEDAIQRQDAATARRGAHTIKGSAEVFSARRVVDRAGQLEERARAGDLSAAPKLFADLRVEVDRLVAEIRRWAQTV